MNFALPTNCGIARSRKMAVQSPVEGMHWRVRNRPGPGIGDRVRQGVCGFVFGVLMVLGASALLFWNEVHY